MIYIYIYIYNIYSVIIDITFEIVDQNKKLTAKEDAIEAKSAMST